MPTPFEPLPSVKKYTAHIADVTDPTLLQKVMVGLLKDALKFCLHYS